MDSFTDSTNMNVNTMNTILEWLVEHGFMTEETSQRAIQLFQVSPIAELDSDNPINGTSLSKTIGNLYQTMGGFDKMTFGELQDLLESRGLPTTGRKKELIARLCAAVSEPTVVFEKTLVSEIDSGKELIPKKFE